MDDVDDAAKEFLESMEYLKYAERMNSIHFDFDLDGDVMATARTMFEDAKRELRLSLFDGMADEFEAAIAKSEIAMIQFVRKLVPREVWVAIRNNPSGAPIEQVDRAITNPVLGEPTSDSAMPDNVPSTQAAPLSDDALADSFIDSTKGFSDAQWSEKFERRYKERAKQGRGKNCKSFYVDNVGGIYYGDGRTFVFKCMGRQGFYSLCTSHSERIGKTIAEKFSLYRRNGRT